MLYSMTNSYEVFISIIIYNKDFLPFLSNPFDQSFEQVLVPLAKLKELGLIPGFTI